MQGRGARVRAPGRKIGLDDGSPVLSSHNDEGRLLSSPARASVLRLLTHS
jgi:hypothetical protein